MAPGARDVYGPLVQCPVTRDAARRRVERYAPGATPEALVEASFRFLLEREPKESILRSFDVSVIGRYFPEFEREIVSRA